VPEQDLLVLGRGRDPIHVANPIPLCETPLAFQTDLPPPPWQADAQQRALLLHLGQDVRPEHRVRAVIASAPVCLNQKTEDAVVDARPGPKPFHEASHE
jgi:hypothetical protein